MRCVIPQITWNSCQQILSLDFDPSCKGENGFYRLVTVGADTNLLVSNICMRRCNSLNFWIDFLHMHRIYFYRFGISVNQIL